MKAAKRVEADVMTPDPYVCRSSGHEAATPADLDAPPWDTIANMTDRCIRCGNITPGLDATAKRFGHSIPERKKVTP